MLDTDTTLPATRSWSAWRNAAYHESLQLAADHRMYATFLDELLAPGYYLSFTSWKAGKSPVRL